MRNNREQFLYQKSQDALAQRNWQTEFDYNKSVADRNYNYQVSRDKVSDSQWNKQFKYQKSRDKVADSQWQKEYELSKKSLASSSRRSSGGSRRSSSRTSSGSTSSSIIDDGNLSKNAQGVMNNIEDMLKGVAKNGLTVGSVIANLKKGNFSGVLKTVKNTASNSVYNAYKNGSITEEEAEAITKKLGL